MLRSPAFTFARHYAEMVVAMLLGMLVLGGLGAVALGAAGVDTDAPAVMLIGMGVTMSVPMVAWMRHRGHGWAPCWEMTAAMLLPTFAALALLWGGVTDDNGALMTIEHAGMFPLMLVAMLLRRDEYTGHSHAARLAA